MSTTNNRPQVQRFMNRCKSTSRAAHETPKYAALWPRREWPGRPHGCPRTVLRNAVLHSTKADSGSGQGDPQFDVNPSPQSSVLQRTPRQLATAYRRPYARLLPAIGILTPKTREMLKTNRYKNIQRLQEHDGVFGLNKDHLAGTYAAAPTSGPQGIKREFLKAYRSLLGA
jgi:hypothetical protein